MGIVAFRFVPFQDLVYTLTYDPHSFGTSICLHGRDNVKLRTSTEFR